MKHLPLLVFLIFLALEVRKLIQYYKINKKINYTSVFGIVPLTVSI